jgi:hypothetical protein
VLDGLLLVTVTVHVDDVRVVLGHLQDVRVCMSVHSSVCLIVRLEEGMRESAA